MNAYQYQPMYQQAYQPSYVPQPTMPTAQQQTGIVWITDENIARNYAVAPGNSVLFMNENEPYLYMKSADATGKPSFRKSRLVDEETTDNKNEDYIKREEIEEIISNAVQKEVEKRMSEISFKPTKRQRTVINDDVEE